ncbi:MAG: 4'-phosphopantetheinyl transferase superfamily protein [Lachnospiraceae bacterium]|nr:4'-phosphopantetheinyl transferase superfamily protein [Lachnospiraceae bacterium]
MKIYLVDVEQLQDKSTGEELSERASLLIDDYRRSKADRCKSPATRGSALGVGLALQLAARGVCSEDPEIGYNSRVIGYGSDDQAGYGSDDRAGSVPEIISVKAEKAVEILEGYGKAVDLKYCFGENGKPFLAPGQKIPAYENGIPFISISHSGRYVALAVSERETGIDLQERKSVSTDKLSGRFFTEKEAEEIRREPELFFTFWTRKEAWGKCEGCGIGPALLKELTESGKEMSDAYRWYEDELPDGYALCVCEKNY